MHPNFSRLTLALTLSLPSQLGAQALADSGTFVVLHARDTVAVEQFTRTPTKLEGTLAIHASKGTSERWSAVVAPDATLPMIEVAVHEAPSGVGMKERISQRARVIFKEDSAAVDVLGGDGIQTRLFATKRGAVPYLNLSFALLEQAVRRAYATPERSQVSFFNLGGGQTVSATLTPLGTDSLQLDIGSVRYHLRVAKDGRLLGARIPAQDVLAERK
jgi:hypothetical protein